SASSLGSGASKTCVPKRSLGTGTEDRVRVMLAGIFTFLIVMLLIGGWLLCAALGFYCAFSSTVRDEVRQRTIEGYAQRGRVPNLFAVDIGLILLRLIAGGCGLTGVIMGIMMFWKLIETLLHAF
ncbi:MAG: hypothetical protein WD066_01490, partial [Planctomycetaceae bacterium]